MLAVIVTRNRPDYLKRCVARLVDLGIEDIVVIDDSPISASVLKNKLAMKGLKISPRHIWHSNVRAALKETPRVISTSDYPRSGDTRLGVAGWNASTARNVAVSIARNSGAHDALFVDDDVVLSELVKGPRCSDIVGFRLACCPDLARSTWLELFLSVASSLSGDKISTRASEYFDTLGQGSAALLLRYTDIGLHLRRTGQVDEVPHVTYDLPSTGAHGAAFIANLRHKQSCLFPPWSNEDHFWFMRAKALGYTFGVASALAQHDPPRKRILDEEAWFAEEVGLLYSRVALAALHGYPSVEHNFRSLAQSRARQLTILGRSALSIRCTNPLQAVVKASSQLCFRLSYRLQSDRFRIISCRLLSRFVEAGQHFSASANVAAPCAL